MEFSCGTGFVGGGGYSIGLGIAPRPSREGATAALADIDVAKLDGVRRGWPAQQRRRPRCRSGGDRDVRRALLRRVREANRS